MTLDELRALYDEAKKIIRAERGQRAWVFRNRPDDLKAKVAEMDRLLAILAQLKDELKPYCELTLEQQPLIDVPRKAEYR